MRERHLEGDALRHLAALFGPTGFQPPVDVYTSDGPDGRAVHVRVEIAGLDPAAASVRVEGRLLVVAGDRRPSAAGRVTYAHMEIAYGPFERRIELPCDVDAGRATATYAAGYLTVSLPAATPRRRARVVVVEVLR
jgi:HSP20 family protein